MEQELIHKDTTIADVLANNPERVRLLSEILTEFGIHCVGCSASAFETLEEGVLSHGYTEEQLSKLVNDLNKAITDKKIKIKKNNVPKNFTIKLTNKALIKLKEMMKKENKKNEVLRVSVLAGGCSGYTYDLEIIPKSLENDLVMKQSGIQISIDNESTEFLNNVVIDFIDTLNESGFKFNNPNATKECGCGKSFS